MGNTMNRARLAIKTFFAVALAILVWGCSEGRSSAPQLNPTTGEHPAAWMQNHWAEYIKHPDQCRTCHGSTSDPAAAGGVAKVSCFTCHANGVNHPEGWAADPATTGKPVPHGRLGAEAAPNPSDPKAMAGFAHCTKCHGDDYNGGISGVSCKKCHTNAPHPDKPWLETTAIDPNHDKTDIGNAPECAKCHTNGANSTRVPTSVPPAGTAPGCYNNTLCHDQHP